MFIRLGRRQTGDRPLHATQIWRFSDGRIFRGSLLLQMELMQLKSDFEPLGIRTASGLKVDQFIEIPRFWFQRASESASSSLFPHSSHKHLANHLIEESKSSTDQFTWNVECVIHII